MLVLICLFGWVCVLCESLPSHCESRELSSSFPEMSLTWMKDIMEEGHDENGVNFQLKLKGLDGSTILTESIKYLAYLFESKYKDPSI